MKRKWKNGDCRVYIGVILRVIYGGSIGIMEKKMETAVGA